MLTPVQETQATRRPARFRLGGSESTQTGALLRAALLLVASGTVALIFQVLWIKQLTLIVGVDVTRLPPA